MRRGTAIAELAVCLPVIATIVFASIEACSMIFLQQALRTAAYEAVRAGVNSNSTTSIAVERGLALLDDRNIVGGHVVVEPSDLSQTARGVPVAVTVSAPSDENRIMPKWFFRTGRLSATCTMLRE